MGIPTLTRTRYIFPWTSPGRLPPFPQQASVLPPDPTIGDLVGNGDTTPPDLPADPLDPDAPTNAPKPPLTDDDETPPDGLKIGPVTVSIEDAGKDGATVGLAVEF